MQTNTDLYQMVSIIMQFIQGITDEDILNGFVPVSPVGVGIVHALFIIGHTSAIFQGDVILSAGLY